MLADWVGSGSIKDLVRHNSLLPLYGFFLPSPVWNQLRTAVHDGVLPNSGLPEVIQEVSTYTRFSFCSSCVSADREAFGETFWHRSHLIPGIIVCPLHQEFLHRLPRKATGTQKLLKGELVTAEKIIPTHVLHQPLDPSNLLHRTALHVAQSAYSLLSHPQCFEYQRRFFKTYFQALRNVLSPSRMTDTGEDFLSLAKSYFKMASAKTRTAYARIWLCWPTRNLHPAYHFLLMSFLNCSFNGLMTGHAPSVWRYAPQPPQSAWLHMFPINEPSTEGQSSNEGTVDGDAS
jgi:hypothetical protein